MSLFVLDTDHLSLYEKGHVQVLRNIARRTTDQIAISVITVEEQLVGWQRVLHQAKDDAKREQIYWRMARTVESLAGWPVVPFSIAAMQRRGTLLRMRLSVGSNDLKIAAITLEAGGTVVTRNLRDFSRVPGVNLEDWST